MVQGCLQQALQLSKGQKPCPSDGGSAQPRSAPDGLLEAGRRALQLRQDGHLQCVPPDVPVVLLARTAAPAKGEGGALGWDVGQGVAQATARDGGGAGQKALLG